MIQQEKKYAPYISLTSKLSLRCMDIIRECGAILERDGINCDYKVKEIERQVDECLKFVAAYREETK